ncbi:MAG: pseudouridine synthase [Sphingomonadaceae bacterium]
MNRPRHRSNPPPAGEAARGERLQKLLAAAGLGSRREIEGWIAQGRVSVSGRTARLGDRATPGDLICLDGAPVRHARRDTGLPRVLLYHKPVGEIVTRSDPGGRPTVFARLPPLATGKWTSVGRLDVNTSGLLVLTDSGELANRLMHPRYGIEREYMVRALGRLEAAERQALLTGVRLEDGRAAFDSLEPAGTAKTESAANRWYRASLREGRKREVRRMFEAVGLRVSRLIRTRFGPLELPGDLPPGQMRELAPGEVRALTERLGLAR